MRPHDVRPIPRQSDERRPFPLNWLAFSPRTLQWIRWGARGWTSIRTPAFLALALSEGVPHSPERAIWEAPLQLGLLGLIDVGSLVAWRREGIGATIVTIGAVLLGALSAMEHQPVQGLAVATAFAIPGVLYWLDWQRTQSLRAVMWLAVALLALLLVGGLAAYAIHAAYHDQPQALQLWHIRLPIAPQ